MRIRLLGPVDFPGAAERSLTAPKRRAVLTLLALEAHHVVPTHRLIQAGWGPEPPATAKAALQGHVAALRKELDGSFELVTRAGGYMLTAPPDQIDVHYFARLRSEAGLAGDAEASALLRKALDLWRGAALTDCGSEELRQAWAPTLEDSRLATLEQWAERLLRLDRGGEAVEDLRAALNRFPSRESVVVSLMLCLRQAGVPDESLKVYEDFRERLADGLGVQPGPALRALSLELADGVRADSTSVPAQLPRKIRHFSGRSAEISRLDEALDRDGQSLAIVTGPAGVGKTALALSWAARRLDRFPDGQLFVDLRGFDTTDPLDPGTVLTGFLQALGVTDAELPQELPDRSELFHTILAGRRLLLVLDNARSAEQVRPILPRAVTTAVLVTSRHRLDDLVVEGDAVPVVVDAMSTSDALDLFGSIAGHARVSAESAAAEQVAALCGRLPLALKLAAARSATHPSWPLRVLVDELKDEEQRLATLATTGNLSVTAALSLSLRGLRPEAARLFTLLGLHPGQTVDPPTAGSLSGISSEAAQELLIQLEIVNLVQQPAPGAYSRHDLVRLYGRQLAQELPRNERDVAFNALLDHYVASAAQAALGQGHLADQLIWPSRTPTGFHPEAFSGTSGASAAWLRREEYAISQLVAEVERRGSDRGAWQLAINASMLYYQQGGYLREWEGLLRTALSVAQKGAEASAVAKVHAELALALEEQGSYRASIEHSKLAASLSAAHGSTMDVHVARMRLANCLVKLGDVDEAVSIMEQLVADLEAASLTFPVAQMLNNLADALMVKGRPAEALPHIERSISLLEGSEHHMLPIALQTHAELLCALGRKEEALARSIEAWTVGREQGSLRLEAYCSDFIGQLLEALGRGAEAAEYTRIAADLFQQQGRATAELRSVAEPSAEAAESRKP